MLDSAQPVTKRTAIAVGALIIISYISVFLGDSISGAVIDQSDFLSDAYPDRVSVNAGVIVSMVNDLVVIGIAVLLYPLLRRFSEAIALWYVSLRVLEGAFFMVAKVHTLAIIELSEDYLAGGGAVTEGLASLALAQRDAANVVATMAFIAGGFVLYYLLWGSEIVPRFIAAWGFLGLASLIVANLASIPDLTQTFEPAMLLYLPIVFNELFLAGWLMVKGFSRPADSHAKPRERELASH